MQRGKGRKSKHKLRLSPPHPHTHTHTYRQRPPVRVEKPTGDDRSPLRGGGEAREGPACGEEEGLPLLVCVCVCWCWCGCVSWTDGFGGVCVCTYILRSFIHQFMCTHLCHHHPVAAGKERSSRGGPSLTDAACWGGVLHD